MNKLILFITALLSSFVVAGSLSQVAFGASDYDNAYVHTDNLIIKRDGCEDLDLTTAYSDYLIDGSIFNWNHGNSPDNQQMIDDWHDALNNNGRWAIGVSNDSKSMYIYFTNDDSLYLSWKTSDVTAMSSSMRTIRLSMRSDCSVFGARSYYETSGIISTANGLTKNFLTYVNEQNYNYPPGYEGQPIPDTWSPPQDLTPEYKGTVSESGLLKVQYLKNLSPFLTGTTYTNIDQMNTNWNGLDSQVGQWVSQPAGLMQEEIQLSGAGYYMLNISHDQQLHSPPWPESHNYTIEQVWIQFYWDGKSFTDFTNIGCSGQICNDFTDDVDPTYKVFSSLGIPLFGLQQVILKPLNFLSEVSNETQNCTPLNLPLPFIDENISLPCMTPIYQNNFGNILLIYQTILTGLFAYYVGLNTFRGIKDLSNPRDDSIEVAKL